jgi:hypothetical protein
MNVFLAKVDTHKGKYRISTSSLETEYREVENFLVDTF